MKNMLNIGIWGLLLVLTACPKKADVVEPKKNDLIGKWEWVVSGCLCPQCKCIFGGNSQSVNRIHYLYIKKESISYFSKDTLLFAFKYEKNTDSSIKIGFENLKDSTQKIKYNYLLLDGIFSFSEDTIKIKNDILFIKLKKI